jgi:pyridoxal phosphate enzyme (YggS family)
MTIADNLRKVEARMAAAARRAQRSPDEITLVAVSKTMPLALIAKAADAGQIDFGENRLEELVEKVDAAAAAGLGAIRWHAIGTIQSRKTKLALGPLALIHAVDRLKIAQRLSRQAAEAGKTLDVLLEVNVSGEESKHGFSPSSLKSALPELLELPALRYCGLMTMAPFVADPEEARPFFRELRCLLENVRRIYPAANYPQAAWSQLSMGMTADFEVAIEEGATIIRVGTAIFGHREYE